ncbi:MAG: efflux RND transporter periplasmic adaptor subunit [Balneolaceae bacterium]
MSIFKILNLKRFLLPVLLPLIIVFAIGCSSDEPNNPGQGGFGQFRGGGQATSVEVVPVTTSSISEQVRSYGTIRAKDVVNVNPQVSNRVTEIHADLGDTVQAGQVMAKIYDVPFRDALEQARAQLRQSRVTFERDSTQFQRQQSLYESNAISSSEYEDALATYENSRAQFEAARASVTQSRENLENTEIRSPVYGVVLSRAISEGDVATTGTTAFEVANLAGYETRLFLAMQDWEDVRIGMPVELQLSNRDGIAGEGVISRISPQLNPATGLGEIVVTLTDMTSSIRQGVLVESRIILLTKEDVVVVPRSALIERVDTYIEPETNTVELRRSYSVFVAQGDSIALRKELELGIEQGDRIEVLSGLEPGERLIVTGHRNLQDEARIRIPGESGQRPAGQGERSIQTE